MADKPLFTKDEIAQLYAPFAPEEHELREGPGNNAKTKISWFTYVRREAIIKRLDELFMGEWSMGYLNQQEPISKIDGTYYCAMHITIRGMRREYDGIGEGNNGQTSLKGASTDAFKRTASMWGLGLYLQNAPQIWTDAYKDSNGKSDWKKKDQVEADAIKRSNAWVASLTNGTPANVMSAQFVDDTPDAPSSDIPDNATDKQIAIWEQVKGNYFTFQEMQTHLVELGKAKKINKNTPNDEVILLLSHKLQETG